MSAEKVQQSSDECVLRSSNGCDAPHPRFRGLLGPVTVASR
jgi:hypothetical protein